MAAHKAHNLEVAGSIPASANSSSRTLNDDLRDDLDRRCREQNRQYLARRFAPDTYLYELRRGGEILGQWSDIAEARRVADRFAARKATAGLRLYQVRLIRTLVADYTIPAPRAARRAKTPANIRQGGRARGLRRDA